MQKKIRIIIIAVIFLLGFCLARDFLIKSLIGTVASGITGAPVSVGGLSLSMIKQSVRITNFKMYNPKGFPKGILADIPRMNITCNLGALITSKIHIKQLGLEIHQIGMVKNKDGKLNVDSLKIADDKTEIKKKKPAKELAIQIDAAILNMGRVVSKDYTAGSQPIVKVYDLNLNKSYNNITSMQQLAALIISEPLKAAGIHGLKVYGASMLFGVAAFPVAAVFTFTGKGHAQETFNVEIGKVYDAGLKAIKIAGKVTSEDRGGGVINAEVYGAGVTLELKKISEKSTQVTVTARNFGFPQPEIASGVMYQLNEQLK